MATRDNECLSFKDKQKGFINSISDDQYTNLNLNNQNYQCVSKETLPSKSVTTVNKKVVNYDLSLSNDLRTGKNLSSWSKASKQSNFLRNGRNLEEDEFKKAKSANNSTLSLHIAAYENLNEATSADPDGLEKEFLKKNGETLGFVKNWGTSNHFNNGSTSIIQNPFEFPRQQDDRIVRPIVMQFTTSQRLINPNQMEANKRYRPSPLYMDPMNSQNRIPIRSVAYRTGGAIRPVAHPGSRIFTVRPSGGTVVHRLTPTRQPDVIDLEAEHGIRTQPVRQYSNYSINGEGISRVRYALPPMNRRPIYARPALRPTYYRTYPGIQQSLGRHRIIPYIPRYPNFRRYDYDPTEEDIDHAIQMEESKMQQEDNAYYYADPDFQRIEANIVKKENMARQQLEKQRLATLTSYHSRSADVNVVQNRQVQQAVQKLMSARSELLIKPNDDAIVTDVKMSLSAVVEQVCQQDRGEGWHKEILKKIRRVPEVPALHSQPIVKRSVQKHSEVMLNERSEFFKREILKRRARLELDVELEYGFVKQTRTGTIACLPCSQIYARIGAPMPEEEIIVRQEPKIEIEETYVYEEQPVNKEYSMESEAIETSDISQQQYIDTSSSALVDIKAEILDSTDSSPTKKGGVEVIRGIKASDGKRTKAGRPTKKEKRQIERENKKILKKQQQELSDDLQQFCGTKTCYCQKIFDPTLDYIKCSYCSLLFHPKCAKLSLSKAEKLSQWFCKGCDPNQTDFESVKTEASTEEVLCICNEPYDANSHWVGCNMCDKWFHPECVNTTIEAVQAAGEYICSACTFQRALHGDTEEGHQIQQNEDGVFYA